MKKTISFLNMMFFGIFLLSSCAPSADQIAPYVQKTVEAISTQTPYPTQTFYPTNTPWPTQTPYSTYTPQATYTPVIIVVTATPTPTPQFTPTITLTPTKTIPPTATLSPQKMTKGNGFYLIGSDIATGIWRSDGKGDECYWAITDKQGHITKNHYGMSGGTAYIPANGFQIELRNCGDWTWLSE